MRKGIDGGRDSIEQRNREREAASIIVAALTFEKAARKVREELNPAGKTSNMRRSGSAPWRLMSSRYLAIKNWMRSRPPTVPMYCVQSG
jgi:hypothetical protein